MLLLKQENEQKILMMYEPILVRPNPGMLIVARGKTVVRLGSWMKPRH